MNNADQLVWRLEHALEEPRVSSSSSAADELSFVLRHAQPGRLYDPSIAGAK
jgi:hypothetical protein